MALTPYCPPSSVSSLHPFFGDAFWFSCTLLLSEDQSNKLPLELSTDSLVDWLLPKHSQKVVPLQNVPICPNKDFWNIVGKIGPKSFYHVMYCWAVLPSACSRGIVISTFSFRLELEAWEFIQPPPAFPRDTLIFPRVIKGRGCGAYTKCLHSLSICP